MHMCVICICVCRHVKRDVWAGVTEGAAECGAHGARPRARPATVGGGGGGGAHQLRLGGRRLELVHSARAQPIVDAHHARVQPPALGEHLLQLVTRHRALLRRREVVRSKALSSQSAYGVAVQHGPAARVRRAARRRVAATLHGRSQGHTRRLEAKRRRAFCAHVVAAEGEPPLEDLRVGDGDEVLEHEPRHRLVLEANLAVDSRRRLRQQPARRSLGARDERALEILRAKRSGASGSA
eukprot:1162091-Prymnesium_polylepis.1